MLTGHRTNPNLIEQQNYYGYSLQKKTSNEVLRIIFSMLLKI